MRAANRGPPDINGTEDAGALSLQPGNRLRACGLAQAHVNTCVSDFSCTCFAYALPAEDCPGGVVLRSLLLLGLSSALAGAACAAWPASMDWSSMGDRGCACAPE